MVEVSLWCLALVMIFAGFGLEAFVVEVKETIKKRKWKYLIVMVSLLTIMYLLVYGVFKCISLGI